MIITIIAFVIVFGVLVTVHEFGHYYVAKRSGILVREFSIGMGPKLFAYRKNGTTYTIRILPLGGYVRMAGLDDEDALQKGMTALLTTDDDEVVRTIDLRRDHPSLTGLPLEVTDWDLQDKLWIEGYETGAGEEVHRFKVARDATVVEPDGTPVQVAPRDVQYQSVSVWKRMLTNVAGPFNNVLLAIAAFMLVAFLRGGAPQVTNAVGRVEPHSVAQKAGLRANDQILRVAGHKTTNWTELTRAIEQRGGQKTTFTVQRNHRVWRVTLTPKVVKQNGKRLGQIGIMGKVVLNHHFFAMVGYGFTQTWMMTKALFGALCTMITHGFHLNDLGGPVAMFSYTEHAAKQGLISIVSLTAFLSINLAIINLLPIPALDGGKILLNLIEAVRRKPISQKVEETLTLIGFGFLMVLMFLVTWNDLRRYFF